MNKVGCPSLPKTVTLQVVPQPTANATLLTNTLGVNTNSMCGNFVNTATLSVATTTLPPGVGAWQYNWTPTVDIYGTINNDTVPVNPNTGPCGLNFLRTYTVTAYYEYLPNCKDADTATIRVINCYPPQLKTLASPGFVQIPLNDTLCQQQCTVLRNNLCGGDSMTIFWTIPGAVPDTVTSKFPVTVCFPVAPKDYSVTMTVTNPYGSYFYVSQPKHYIHVVDTPDAVRASADPIGIRDTCIRYGSCLPLYALNLGPNTYVQWSPPENLDNKNSPTPIACPTVNTTYILTAYNSKKCKYNDTMTVCVEPDCGEMYIPNAFSPNSDGNNDVLYVRGKCLKNMIFMVFNRWGEKVFESTNQADGWDGTYKGSLMNTGVFVYRLEGTTFQGEAYSKKGNITLMR
jgi:gliding motility-associated-like protein